MVQNYTIDQSNICDECDSYSERLWHNNKNGLNYCPECRSLVVESSRSIKSAKSSKGWDDGEA